MEPTAEEIAADLERLATRIRAYSDDPIGQLEKDSLSKATAYCVEMVRRKYKLVSAYYAAAECAAQIVYDRKYNGLKFH